MKQLLWIFNRLIRSRNMLNPLDQRWFRWRTGRYQSRHTTPHGWLALVEDIEGEGSGLPQFPFSLDWIANNQLPDGSWGDSESFTSPDRIINTIACAVALKSWNVHPGKCENGMAYFKNISNLRNENAVHMPFGFEVAFPSILELARSLNLEVPDDCPVLNEIYAMRNIKLEKHNLLNNYRGHKEREGAAMVERKRDV
nr:ent-copalyl diphosphate synthase, chloroplastic-like [Malus domestica]